MAINIQEILHPSDSDAIKFEKINYNFDQIVAAGGGPSGQKGQIGDQGAVGPQGQQGTKGEKGDQGPVGATTSPWQAISVTSAQSNPYTVLKPKLNTDSHQPVIFVGDVTFNENTPEDGLTSLRGSINIGRHSMVDNDTSPEYINLWHGSNVSSSQNHAIQISSADSQEFTGVRWTFGRLFGSPDPSVSADELYIDFNRLNFGATAKVGFDGQDSSFKLPLSNSAGLSGTPELGMIRFNAGVYQGVIDVNGTPTWTNFCMAPCGQGGGETYSIEIQPGDDLQLNSEGGPANNSVSFSPAGDVELDENGNAWNGGPVATTTTAAPATTTTTAAPATTTTQAPTTQAPTTNTPTYTTTWTASANGVSNATVHVSDSPGSPADNTDTRIAAAGTVVTRTFYVKPNSNYEFTNINQVTASASQGSATVAEITANGSIRINVAHTTNATNNNITVTLSGAASAIQYTVTITANSTIGNATVYTDATGGSPNNVITRTGSAGSGIGDAFYIEANSGYNISPSQVSVSSWGGGGSNYYVNPNVNSAGRVVVGWNDSLDPNNLNFSIGIAGTVSQFTYTAQVAETNDWSTICSQNSATTTFTYPQGEGGTNFQNYFQNNYTVGGSYGAMKIISSNEPGFAYSGWAIGLNDQNEASSGQGWTNCGNQQGSSVSISGEEWIYTMGGPEDYTATATNVYGSGGYGTAPTYSWTIGGIDASKFELTNANQQVATVEYIWTADCGGGGSDATLTCTVSGFNAQGQAISPVANTFDINGCDDSGESESSGG